MKIIYKIKQVRERKGFNQPRLAEKSGVQQAIISKAERNIKTITTSTLCRLAKALDCEITDLFTIEEAA